VNEIKAGAKKALQDCLALKAGEKFLVITDKARRKIGVSFFEAAAELGAEALLLEIMPTGMHGKEPHAMVAKLWQEVDVFVTPTTFSLSHTKARSKAVANGARGATLPGITPEIMGRALNVDYIKMEDFTIKLAEEINRGKIIKLTTPAGTDLVFSVEGRKADPDTGVYRKSGTWGNLPAGEAYVAPLEGTAQGLLVVDGSMSGVGRVKEPIKIKIKDGKAVSFSGGSGAKKLASLFAKQPELAKSVAEFGVGTNPSARICGNVLEDEKVMGTVHIALGNNLHFGGVVDVPIHLDGILQCPTFSVDGKVIMKEGKFVF
jgi:leucyl aminopeptidase (aminopeptidase T)